MTTTLADLEAAQQRLTVADQELRRRVVDAHRAGTPVTDIARAAGITRQTVYRWAGQWHPKR